MKTVRFSYKEENKMELTGTITVKNNGNISILLDYPRQYSYYQRQEAKLLAKQIIESGFKHEAVTEFYEEDITLVDILKQQTQEVKQLFLEETKQFAKNYFSQAKQKINAGLEKWYEEYAIPFEYSNNVSSSGEKHIRPLNYTREYYTMLTALRRMEKLVEKGIDKFEKDELKKAKMHYENSIIKLSDKLRKKGVNHKEEINIRKAGTGTNLELTIEHDGMITRARTIMASGLSRRPHYRYLVR